MKHNCLRISMMKLITVHYTHICFSYHIKSLILHKMFLQNLTGEYNGSDVHVIILPAEEVVQKVVVSADSQVTSDSTIYSR